MSLVVKITTTVGAVESSYKKLCLHGLGPPREAVLLSKFRAVKVPCHQTSMPTYFRVIKLPCHQTSVSSNFRLVKLPSRQTSVSSNFRLVKLPSRQTSVSSNFRIRQSENYFFILKENQKIISPFGIAEEKQKIISWLHRTSRKLFSGF